MTALGAIQLQQNQLDDVKVSFGRCSGTYHSSKKKKKIYLHGVADAEINTQYQYNIVVLFEDTPGMLTKNTNLGKHAYGL